MLKIGIGTGNNNMKEAHVVEYHLDLQLCIRE